jgi:hypothetical protein
MKKLTMCTLIFILSACSNVKTSMIVNEEMLIGAWNCVSSNYDSDLEAEVTYHKAGFFDEKTTIKSQVPDVKGEFLYQINRTGTWELKGNTVYETIDEYDILSLSELSIAFENVMKKKLDKHNKTYSTIVTIEESKLNWIKDGLPMSCSRISI